MRAQFLTVLRLDDLGAPPWSLALPLRFYSVDLDRTVRVDPPFVTDLASIPRGLWNILPKTGPQDYPAVIHDAGYQLQLRADDGRFFPATKAQVDRLFYEGLQAVGVPTWRAWAMWLAVRVFGKGRWQDAAART